MGLREVYIALREPQRLKEKGGKDPFDTGEDV